MKPIGIVTLPLGTFLLLTPLSSLNNASATTINHVNTLAGRPQPPNASPIPSHQLQSVVFLAMSKPPGDWTKPEHALYPSSSYGGSLGKSSARGARTNGKSHPSYLTRP